MVELQAAVDACARLGLSVRKATANDAAGVAGVLNEVIAGGRHSLLDTPFSDESEREYLMSLPKEAFVQVAETSTRGIVAFQSLEPWGGFATHVFEHVATMGTYVTEGLRRMGIGRRLAQVSFAQARELGYEKVFTEVRADNAESLSYYLGLGFTVVGAARRQARLRGSCVDVVFIERFL